MCCVFVAEEVAARTAETGEVTDVEQMAERKQSQGDHFLTFVFWQDLVTTVFVAVISADGNAVTIGSSSSSLLVAIAADYY